MSHSQSLGALRGFTLAEARLFAERSLGPASAAWLASEEAGKRVEARAGQVELRDAVLGELHRGACTDRRIANEYMAYLMADLEKLGESILARGRHRRVERVDLVQSVVGDLLPRLPEVRFETMPQFLAYVANKMRWKAADRCRQRRAAERRDARVGQERWDQRGGAAAEAEPIEPLAEREERERLAAVLDRLPAREAQVLRLALRGREVSAIASALGISSAAVYKALQRATARARKLAAES